MSYLINWEYGWGYNIRKIDVLRIKTIKYDKRFFMLFQRNLPYTMTIEYNELQKNLINKTRLIKFRLPTENNCINEIKKIKEKQEDLKSDMFTMIIEKFYTNN